MKLLLDEVRRLTGPHLLGQRPGAIVDAIIEDGDSSKVIKTWHDWLHKFLPSFGWQNAETYARSFDGGVSLVLSAPLDVLYTACDVAELAWDCTVAELCSEPCPDWEGRLEQLRADLAEEQNPQLLELLTQAESKGVAWLVDDDEFSLGLGAHSKTWPLTSLPELEEIDWTAFSRIPLAYITGTNGKSTSVRLADSIAKAAGLSSGVTSTDFIRVGSDIIDRGDYSGPGGARILLRDPRTEIAFLEVARGGILRRGLPVPHVDAALVTNVANDHLGQYGINTVAELASAKFVVSKALSEDGVLVVNADNPPSVAEVKALTSVRLTWFSRDQDHPLLAARRHLGDTIVTVRDNHFVLTDDNGDVDFGAVSAAPMTMQGSALHNIENALGVIGMCHALKLPQSAIIEGLSAFGSDAADNPGRGNIYQLPDCKVLVDFAHNHHSMMAIVNTARAMPGNRTITMFGHAGDRSDQDIVDLTKAVAESEASHYIISELHHYLRGREPGELPAIMQATLEEGGVDKACISIVQSPLEGVKLAVESAQPGDVLLMLVLDQRDDIHAWLSSKVVTS